MHTGRHKDAEPLYETARIYRDMLIGCVFGGFNPVFLVFQKRAGPLFPNPGHGPGAQARHRSSADSLSAPLQAPPVHRQRAQRRPQLCSRRRRRRPQIREQLQNVGLVGSIRSHFLPPESIGIGPTLDIPPTLLIGYGGDLGCLRTQRYVVGGGHADPGYTRTCWLYSMTPVGGALRRVYNY